jgi:hypothetical protein
MPLPPEAIVVEVFGRFLRQDGSPQQGEIVFINRSYLVAIPSQNTLVPIRIEATLDAEGDVTADLIATDDPAIFPGGSVWEVQERWASRGGGRQYKIEVPAATPPGGLNLATVAPVPWARRDEPDAFVTLAAWAALAGRLDVVEGSSGISPFVHEQTTPSASWNVVHNRGRPPLTAVYVDDEEVITDVEVVDPNTVHIVFPSAQAGTAVLH